jgi:ElaB/YqjD/DUF883 family membrane-anchored ribosome-binding protein
MENETTTDKSTSGVFTNSRQDVSNLKETATHAASDLRDTAATHLDKAKGNVNDLKATAIDAARDLKSTAAGHVEKAKGQLSDLKAHAQQEGKQSVDQLRGQFADVASSARDYIASRPLASVGIALGVGFLFGLSRRRD